MQEKCVYCRRDTNAETVDICIDKSFIMYQYECNKTILFGRKISCGNIDQRDMDSKDCQFCEENRRYSGKAVFILYTGSQCFGFVFSSCQILPFISFL